MSDVQFQPLWGEPPSKKGGGRNTQVDLALEAFIQLMRTAPGRWAELSSPNDKGHPASRGAIIKKRYPDAEIETRAVPGSKTNRRIWVRIRAEVPDVIAANGEYQSRRDRAAEAT